MTIQVQLYDTSTLLGKYKDAPDPSTYFSDLAVGRSFESTDEWIDFEKIRAGRKLAPLVLPTRPGQAIYSEHTKIFRFKPAYVKIKDAIRPERVLKRRPSEALWSMNSLTPLQRYQAILLDMIADHKDALERRKEWMTARAVIDGKITLEDRDYGKVVLDFQRQAANTVTLATNLWSDPNTDIMSQLNTWIAQCRKSPFGGPVNRLTVGSAVAGYIIKNASVLKQLDMFTRGTNANLNTGLRQGQYVEYIGNLGPNMQLWVNDDFYEKPDGTTAKFLEEDSVVLTGPNIGGVMAYGVINDVDAGFQAMPIYQKNWSEKDPGNTYLLTQSAPLFVPINPNNTLKAKVI